MTEKAMPVSLKGVTSTNDDPSRCVICSEPFAVGLYQRVSALNACCGKRACIDCSRKPGAFYVQSKDCCVLCHTSGVRTSIGLVKKKAKQGHAWAQTLLGRCFFIGGAVKESNHEALRWFRKAAASGHPFAAVMVGQMLLQGDGCERNLSSARAHFGRTISLDENVAGTARELLVNVAVSYQESREFDTAITILAPLAELGVNHARHNLGIAYSNNGDVSSALDIYGQTASEGLVEEPAAFDSLIMCRSIGNMWPQARFWLSMGTKNLRSLLSSCGDPKRVLGVIVGVRTGLREIRDQCGGCGAALQGDMRKKCGGCKTFCYCNRDCQKAHWNRSKDGHREECKEVMELRRKVKDARKESKSGNK